MYFHFCWLPFYWQHQVNPCNCTSHHIPRCWVFSWWESVKFIVNDTKQSACFIHCILEYSFFFQLVLKPIKLFQLCISLESPQLHEIGCKINNNILLTTFQIPPNDTIFNKNPVRTWTKWFYIISWSKPKYSKDQTTILDWRFSFSSDLSLITLIGR